ncbi:hypothetical protein LZ318_17470 [Saccharopolyspora indica]|uniref:hypothetical protein n=1 Tax=Saccharopolyspora indica TaxID=1229659 RepID=UPI0022EA4623|nr:hypothetical protein [Saccharopolyspora indica]MDA3648526.1 hypothetical protein [Saccharopolyspora indica]
MTFSRACLLAAPLCFAGYGIARLVGRMDGQYGPGLDWQVAHILELIGLALLVPAVLGVRRELAARSRTFWTVVTLAGAATAAVQFAVDVVAGLLAADKAEMNAITARFSEIPGAQAVFYIAGPPLMYVGLLALTILCARAEKLAWWGPVLLFAGSALPLITLDLLPIAALCVLVALAPLALRNETAG